MPLSIFLKLTAASKYSLADNLYSLYGNKCARRPLSGVRISGDTRREVLFPSGGITAYDDSRWNWTIPVWLFISVPIKKAANRQLFVICSMAPPAGFEPTLREPESRVLSIYTTGANYVTRKSSDSFIIVKIPALCKGDFQFDSWRIKLPGNCQAITVPPRIQPGHILQYSNNSTFKSGARGYAELGKYMEVFG